MLSPRQAAIKGRMTRYVGRPCVKGHNGLRYVASMKCCQCEYERDKHRPSKTNPNRVRTKTEINDGCVC